MHGSLEDDKVKQLEHTYVIEYMLHIIYAIILIISIMYIMQINAILFIELLVITAMYSIDVELFIIFLA